MKKVLSKIVLVLFVLGILATILIFIAIMIDPAPTDIIPHPISFPLPVKLILFIIGGAYIYIPTALLGVVYFKLKRSKQQNLKE